MKYEKIMKHPARTEILNMLAEKKMGLRAIQNKIKELYPDNPEWHVSETTLRKFMTEGVQVVRDRMASQDLTARFNAYIRKNEDSIPETYSRAYPEQQSYVTRDYDVLAQQIQEELNQMDTIIGSVLMDSRYLYEQMKQEVLDGERSVRDLKDVFSMFKDSVAMYKTYCSPQKTTAANTYDDYLSRLDELEEGEADE